MSYCAEAPVPASPIAANFAEFGEEGSAKSWAVTVHQTETAIRIVVRRTAGFRSIASTKDTCNLAAEVGFGSCPINRRGEPPEVHQSRTRLKHDPGFTHTRSFSSR